MSPLTWNRIKKKLSPLLISLEGAPLWLSGVPDHRVPSPTPSALVKVVRNPAERCIRDLGGSMLTLESRRPNRASEKLNDLSEVTLKCLKESRPELCLQIPIWCFFQTLHVFWNRSSCLASDTVTNCWRFSRMRKLMPSLWRTNSLPTF